MLQNRPPIIVILGHVDHGKTTLLDYLRKSNLAAREAGGITQTIRSFQLAMPAVASAKEGKLITFIDTPGHAAFAQMRSRGSKAADIALLIVAGNDGVMPQTKEAYEAISKSGIPFIVVITKSDLAESDPDRVKTQLTEIGIIVEDFGGTVPAVAVSGKTGQGISELLEMIDLMRELSPPQADPDGQLEAVVVESKLDSKKGPLAEVIVKNGTLSLGQLLFNSAPVGKVKALLDFENTQIKTALPSVPVEILGLTSVPPVGSVLSDKPILNPQPSNVKTPTSIVNGQSSINVILKADVLGSLEAITNQLDPKISVLSSTTGEVNDTDVLSAKSSNAIIVAFNLKIGASVQKLAEIEKVRVKSFGIIYELFDYLDLLVNPKETEKILGKALIGAEFKIGPDRIAGCKVTEGLLQKSDTVRLVRGDKVIGQTKFKSLQTGKTLIDKVKVGQEFGATLSPYLDFKVGDIIIAFATYGTP